MLIARVMAFALLASLSACGNSTVTFDKEKWASGKDNFEGKNPRIYMVSDAEAAGVKVGAKRAAVRDLLGEPDGTGPLGDSWYLGQSTVAPDFERNCDQSIYLEYVI
jgi:outer membrane protein assembly factor BamE (lipoprotein component of BamABCDE complex)